MNKDNKITILLVDDDVIIHLDKKISLENLGYNVISANSGEKALQIFKNNQDIDLVLMDIELGKGIDGSQTTILILKEREVPVIFLSSHKEPEIVKKTGLITSYGYVVKDSDIMVLEISIKMALRLFEVKKALILRESYLTAIIENQPGMLWLKDVDSKFLVVNKNTSDFYGLNSPDLLVGKSDFDICPKDFAEKYIADDIKVMKTKKSFKIEEPISVKENIIGKGNNGWFETYKTPILDKNGIVIGITGYAFDITDHKITENELIEHEKDSRRSFEEHTSAQLIIDPVTGNIFDANNAASKYYGLSREELRKMNINQINGFSEEKNQKEMKKSKEEALLESLNRLDTIINTIAAPIFIKDRKHRWIISNEAHCQFMGLKREEIIGRDDYYYYPKEEADIFWEKDEEVFNTGKPNINEELNTDQSGNIRYTITKKTLYTDDRGEKFIVGIINDITERKLAEEALHDSTAKLETLFRVSPLAITLLDINGNVQLWNKATENIFGWTAQEITGRPNPIIPENNLDQYSVKSIQVIQDATVVNWEVDCQRKDGSTVNVSVSSSPVYDAAGNINGRMSIITDITERKQYEVKIKKLLEEKELILKEVHHRIKNDMNTISGLLMLQGETLKDPSAIEALKDAGNRVQSMMILYEKLYQSDDFTNISVINYLSSLVEEVVANFPNSKSVKIEKKIDDFIIDVKTLQSLGIIINELLTNIMKYAFTGRNDGLIKVSVLLKGNNVIVIVEDNGSGINESVDFDNSKGFGLKLIGMMVKQIKGTIRIERGNGSSFSVGTKIILEFEK